MIQKITACACIYQNVDGVAKILITQRALNSPFLPGAYEIPGGHIEPGEDLEVGLKREIMEELGININLQNPFAAFTYTHNDVHTIEVVYFATPESTNIVLQKDELASYRWITKDDINSLVVPTKNEDDHEIPILHNAFKLLS